MKLGRNSLLFTLALLALGVVGGSTASAQNLTPCNANFPDYSPDFSLNQACLFLNGTPANSGYPGFYDPAAPASEPSGTPNPAGSVPSGVNTVLRLTPNSTYTTGSAWFNTMQLVGSSFRTTFTFQLSGSVPASSGPADGIAFVIQNSGASALGPNGCGIGFGDAPDGSCTPATGGIASSLAVEFDTYQNGDIGDVSNSHVSVQSCGTGANSVDESCRLQIPSASVGVLTWADVNLLTLQSPINLADGNVHTATISYASPASPSQTSCIVSSVPGPCLDVIVDGNDLFPAGIPFDMTTLGLSSGTAYVGFTAATGGGDDNQDILSWVFTPQGQTQTLQPGVPATYNFLNPQGQTAYTYQVTLSSSNNSSPTTTTITPIYVSSQQCDALVEQTPAYTGAQCVVYTNLGTNIQDSPVMFEVTCPNLTNDQCDPFTAQLGTQYTLSSSNILSLTCIDSNTCTGSNNPYPGWLKGAGPDPKHPCTPPQSGSLFQSNQISGFSVDQITHGNSGGTGSCWVATYDMPGESLPGITISAPTNGLIVAASNTVSTSYTCSNPLGSEPSTSQVGPYLTTASCTQSIGTQTSCSLPGPSGISCTGSFTAPSTPGSYPFTVTGTDTGENGNTATVNYTVVGPTNLQIASLGTPGPIATGGYITYGIFVGDLGSVNADGVVVTDLLPTNTRFVSGSGSNVACSIVNKKLSCSTTPIQCSASGLTVTCSVGTLAPLSISDLNGGAITIKVEVMSKPTTTCGPNPCTINTATVSAINTDTNSNPSSTVNTTW
jgi:uncharacterized repeat protein (TIGR01451 family)